MTKERFTVGKMEMVSDHLSTRFFIIDTEKNKYYDVRHMISEGFEVQYDNWAKAICELLNELEEEKEDLEKDNEKLKYQLNDCLNKKLFSRRKIEEENSILKKEYKTLLHNRRLQN